MRQIPVKVAKRYAATLIELCPMEEHDATREALEALARVWQNDPQLARTLLNPSLPQAEREAVLRELGQRLLPNRPQFQNFLVVLSQSDRLPAIPVIAREFGRMVDEVRKLLSLEVASAQELSDEERSQFLERLRADLGPMVTVRWHVEPRLVGGLTVKIGDRLLDGSVQGMLERVRVALSA